MHCRILSILPFLAVCAGLCRADDGTTEIPLAQVPKVVLEAVKKKFPEAKPETATKGLDGNQPFYDVQAKLKSRNVWVTCNVQGTILVIDREISFQELPKPVAGAVSKKYPKAAIRGVNEIAEAAETVYDLALTFNGKKLIAIFDPSGKFVEESEDDEP